MMSLCQIMVRPQWQEGAHIPSAVQDPEAFVTDMASIFDNLNLSDIAEHTSEIMQSMMEKIRSHQVTMAPLPSLLSQSIEKPDC